MDQNEAFGSFVYEEVDGYTLTSWFQPVEGWNRFGLLVRRKRRGGLRDPARATGAWKAVALRYFLWDATYPSDMTGNIHTLAHIPSPQGKPVSTRFWRPQL
jgi:hypothetical protein